METNMWCDHVHSQDHSLAPSSVPNTRLYQAWSLNTVSVYQDTEDQYVAQLVVATLVPITKLQCKQTVVTDFCIHFVNKIHIIGKGMIKETWIAKIKEIRWWTEELITFCFSFFGRIRMA